MSKDGGALRRRVGAQRLPWAEHGLQQGKQPEQTGENKTKTLFVGKETGENKTKTLFVGKEAEILSVP